MLEKDILFSAAENLKKWISLSVQIMESNDQRIDAILKIGNKQNYEVEIKRTIHTTNLPDLLNQLADYALNSALVVAQSISQGARDILQQKKINYLDTAGNCYIYNHHGIYIHIDGKKNKPIINSIKPPIFSKNGIKLIFALLTKVSQELTI